MHWNEKIQLIKSRFSPGDFSVPMVGRKKILRKIETAFISRPIESLEMNTHPGPFRAWWNNIQADQDSHLPLTELPSLMKSLDEHQNHWLGCENTAGDVWIYKAKPEAASELIMTGQTWVNTYHLITMDCSRLLAIQINNKQLHIKKKFSKQMTD